MKWQILAVGKPKLTFASAGIAEYVKRLPAFARVEMGFVKAGESDSESAGLLRRSDGAFRIILDERGEQITSRELAAKIGAWEQRSVSSVAVLIGGANGHAAAAREAADWTWSLSRLTLQHEFALLLTLEQIYRAYTIKAGLPYHRE